MTLFGADLNIKFFDLMQQPKSYLLIEIGTPCKFTYWCF